MSIFSEMDTAERSAFIKETFSKARDDKERIPLLQYYVLVARNLGAIPTKLGLRIIKGLSKIKGKS